VNEETRKNTGGKNSKTTNSRIVSSYTNNNPFQSSIPSQQYIASHNYVQFAENASRSQEESLDRKSSNAQRRILTEPDKSGVGFVPQFKEGSQNNLQNTN